jgi:hypothetical protein
VQHNSFEVEDTTLTQSLMVPDSAEMSVVDVRAGDESTGVAFGANPEAAVKVNHC